MSWHGRWYAVGHDRDRDDTRVFRLSRVAGPVTPIGAPGEVVVPDKVDFRGQVAALAEDQPRAEARLRARTGAGVALRRRASGETPGDGWDELVVPFGDAEVLAQEVAGYGADVVALAPPELRDAVVRRLRAVLGEDR